MSGSTRSMGAIPIHSEILADMSYYENIYNDFPLRCGKLWENLREKAEGQGLDVTFMLMTAAAGLAGTFEHLKIQANEVGKAKDHPASKNLDQDHYAEVIKGLETAINCKIAQSPLFKSITFKGWLFRTVLHRSEILNYLERPFESIGTHLEIKSARDVIKIFRNALAHSNFYAFNRSGAAEIDEIAFFSEFRGKWDPDLKECPLIGYNVISLPHGDFAAFLDAWFKLLKDVDPSAANLRTAISSVLHEEILEDAA